VGVTVGVITVAAAATLFFCYRKRQNKKKVVELLDAGGERVVGDSDTKARPRNWTSSTEGASTVRYNTESLKKGGTMTALANPMEGYHHPGARNQIPVIHPIDWQVHEMGHSPRDDAHKMPSEYNFSPKSDFRTISRSFRESILPFEEHLLRYPRRG